MGMELTGLMVWSGGSVSGSADAAAVEGYGNDLGERGRVRLCCSLDRMSCGRTDGSLRDTELTCSGPNLVRSCWRIDRDSHHCDPCRSHVECLRYSRWSTGDRGSCVDSVGRRKRSQR